MEGKGHEGKSLRRHGFHHLYTLDSTTHCWNAQLVFNLSSLSLCAQYPALCLTPGRHPIVFVGLVNKYTNPTN